MVPQNLNVLITSAGGTVGPMLCDMIANSSCVSNVIAVDAAYCPSHIVSAAKSYAIPPAHDTSFMDTIKNIVENDSIDLILPLSEEDCLQISNGIGRYWDVEKYIGCTKPSLDIITNKLLCYDKLASHGVRVPRYEKVLSFASVDDQLLKLGYPQKKVVFKPITGRGSRGVKVITNSIDVWSQFKSREPIVEISAEQLKLALNDGKPNIEDYFFSEFIGDESFSVDIIAKNGKMLRCYPHKRLGYKWGWVDHAEIFFDKRIAEESEKISAILELNGFCNIEFGIDDQMELSVIEVNGRTSATMYQNSFVDNDPLYIYYSGTQIIEFSNRAEYRMISSASRMQK